MADAIAPNGIAPPTALSCVLPVDTSASLMPPSDNSVTGLSRDPPGTEVWHR
jgi:hypothetical protein